MSHKILLHSSPKHSNYSKPSKTNYMKAEFREIISANFTPVHKSNTITDRDSMKQDILDAVSRRTESVMGQDYKDNMYEDPKNIIGTKPPKPPRKRDLQAIAVLTSEPDPNPQQVNTKSLMRDQRRRLTKKYEDLITTLMDKCEDNIVQLSEKESHISKLKEKLKQVLEYNKLFAEENDTLKTQYQTLVKYVEDCKKVIKEERERSTQLEERCKELEQRIGRFSEPDRDPPSLSGIPLVEVCMSCNRMQIALTQARDQTARAQKDMRAMKDVLYRLNIQLARYQEKLRAQHSLTPDCKDTAYKPGDRYDGLDSLITAALNKDVHSEDGRRSKSPEDNAPRTVDISGLLSAQALAPLFDAYQENIQEKDNLILDYEKQLEIINKKTKEIVTENKTLAEKVHGLEDELAKVGQSYKKVAVEKETADIEKATLVERAERAEAKLKEVYECYEDKMAAMMRDYETVHREYFAVKTALNASEGKVAQIDVLRARTVPADLHERRLEHCKRLLEDLKHQYTLESERKDEHTKKIQDLLKTAEDKYNKLCQEHNGTIQELNAALKNVKLYRKAAQVFRQRAKAASARVRRSILYERTTKPSGTHQNYQYSANKLKKLRDDLKTVKSRAQTSLTALEKEIQHHMKQTQQDMMHANMELEYKEAVIKNLLDRLNQLPSAKAKDA